MNVSRTKYKRLALWFFKYFPIMTAFIMYINTILSMHGISTGYAESLCGISLMPLIFSYCLSKGLGYCKIHRMFIEYTAVIFGCIQWHQWVGFSSLLYPQLITLVLGTILFIYFFINFKEFYLSKPKEY